jgi:hypothetical protein
VARATITPTCGLTSTVEAMQEDMQRVTLKIDSQCKAIRQIADELIEVDPFQEMSSRRGTPRTLELGMKYCTHASCPVPSAIIKVVEVAAGMDLPKPVAITITAD